MSYYRSYAAKLKANQLKNIGLFPANATASTSNTPFLAEASLSSTPVSSSAHQSVVAVENAPGLSLSLCNRDRVNLQSHELVWCDVSANASGVAKMTVTVTELRKIVDYTKLFGNAEECKQYLQHTKDTVTFFVCSSSLDEKFVPEIRQLQNVRSIYVYCQNGMYYPQWFVQHEKVKQMYTDLQLLLADLKRDVKKYLSPENMDLSVGFGNTDRTSGTYIFSWWNYFIQALCHLPYSEECRQRLIVVLRHYYEGKEAELMVLREFELKYTCEDAVRWYTRPTFLYDLLNKALRQHNIELVFLFGFYIQDLYRQLNKEYEGNKREIITELVTRVFRGQIMSIAEMNFNFQKGNTIEINSFFSTSRDPSVPLTFLPSLSSIPEGFVRVLLEINFNARHITRPYAGIKHLSALRHENEVLVMSGTIFAVQAVTYDTENGIYNIKLISVNENNMKRAVFYSDATPRTALKKCADVIFSRMFVQASIQEIDSVFNQLKNLYPAEKSWLVAERNFCLGSYHKCHQTDFYEVRSYYISAKLIWEDHQEDRELNCAVNIADILMQIADAYLLVECPDGADRFTDVAVPVYEAALESARPRRETAEIYCILAQIFTTKSKRTTTDVEKKGHQLTALRYRELQLQELLKFCESDDTQLFYCYRETTKLQEELGNFGEALMNCERQCRVLVANNDMAHLVTTYSKMVKICSEIKDDYESALKYQLLKHELITRQNEVQLFHNEENIIRNKRNIAESHVEIADIYTNLRQFGAVRDNLTAAKKLYEEINNTCTNKEKEIETIEELLSALESYLGDKPPHEILVVGNRFSFWRWRA